MRTLACLALMSFLVGCGDDDVEQVREDAGHTDHDSSVSDSATAVDSSSHDASAAATFCDTLCSHESACNPKELSRFCLDNCEAQHQWFFRPEALDAIGECLSESCDVDEDACYTSSAEALGTRSVDTALRNACTESKCELPSDLCAEDNATENLNEQNVEELVACALMTDCEAAGECLDMSLPPK